ncbi:hypothetical protein [Mailhella massiliensis]|uniref:hypothetical protein n=1 Tax=Mailhella massiliensis TaxID=1903261 RepID=UPI0023F230AB|nr:hypothetical protein [Mailhella massiliensis]
MLKQNYPALWRKSLTSRAGMRVFYTGSSQYHMFFCVPSEKNEGRTLRFCVSAPGRKRGTPCVFPGKEKILLSPTEKYRTARSGKEEIFICQPKAGIVFSEKIGYPEIWKRCHENTCYLPDKGLVWLTH